MYKNMLYSYDDRTLDKDAVNLNVNCLVYLKAPGTNDQYIESSDDEDEYDNRFVEKFSKGRKVVSTVYNKHENGTFIRNNNNMLYYIIIPEHIPKI